jgi:hypothetical protein
MEHIGTAIKVGLKPNGIMIILYGQVGNFVG